MHPRVVNICGACFDKPVLRKCSLSQEENDILNIYSRSFRTRIKKWKNTTQEMWVLGRMYVCVCIRLYVCTYVYACMYLRIYVYLCVCIHAAMCICIYLYTHVCTQTCLRPTHSVQFPAQLWDCARICGLVELRCDMPTAFTPLPA